MKDDNNLITGIAIDQYIDLQHDNAEINTDIDEAPDSDVITPDVVRDMEDPDQWGPETGVTDDGPEQVS